MSNSAIRDVLRNRNVASLRNEKAQASRLDMLADKFITDFAKYNQTHRTPLEIAGYYQNFLIEHNLILAHQSAKFFKLVVERTEEGTTIILSS